MMTMHVERLEDFAMIMTSTLVTRANTPVGRKAASLEAVTAACQVCVVVDLQGGSSN